MKYLIEYDIKCNEYKIYDMKNKKECYMPECIKRISGEALDELIEIFLYGILNK